MGDPLGMNANTITPPSSNTRPESAAGLKTILAKHPFFQNLSPHHIRLLADLAMLVQFKPGELILREGDPANRFYLIHKGRVALESYVQDRGVKLVDTAEAGEVLGWSWLFPPYYSHFDARALEPTEAVFFYGTPLRDECERDHDLGYELMKRMTEVMIKRLKTFRRQMLDLDKCPP